MNKQLFVVLEHRPSRRAIPPGKDTQHLALSNILIDSCASRGDTARTPAVAACDLAYDAKCHVHARWNRENGFHAARSAPQGLLRRVH
ncbi:hypothetical protein F2P46_26745 [Massilia sp. CCM 8734]|nr:hypothetical protein [Massilia sp. CCM 8734]